MTPDQILAMAKQAGLAADGPYLLPRNMDAILRCAVLVAEKGHVMTGLMRAKEMVDDKLQRVWRENERIAA